MAVYRCEFKIISRGKGHRACAAAAYRAGEKINDDHYGLQHNYSNKPGVVTSFILLPEQTPEWMRDREQLWNAVEAVEKRKDAQLSREVLLSLPHELTDDQRSALVTSFVEKNFVAHGMIADVSIHKPEDKSDHRNHHAHVMLTMRELTRDGFGQKVRAWNHRTFLEQIREDWASHQNRHFDRLGLEERVDHRSLADQGVNREPEPKLGKFANENLRDGTFENANRVIENYFETLDRNQQRAELEYQENIINLALARIDRGDNIPKQQQADLLARHAIEMACINTQQASEQAQLVARQTREIKEFKSLSKQHLVQAQETARPSRIQRLYELLTLQRRRAEQGRAIDHEQRKAAELKSIRDIERMMCEEHIKLRDKHQQAAVMLREAHQFERDVLTGRVEVEAALSPPQKHYRECPQIAVNAPLPSLTPQLVPKPPALHTNIIKLRTKEILRDLEEQERTGKPARQSPIGKSFGDWDNRSPRIDYSHTVEKSSMARSPKPKEKIPLSERSISSEAAKAFAQGSTSPQKETTVSKTKADQSLMDRTIKEAANKSFEKPRAKSKFEKKPIQEKVTEKTQEKTKFKQAKKPEIKRRKRKSAELSEGERRAKVIRQQKARQKREREARARGEDFGRKR